MIGSYLHSEWNDFQLGYNNGSNSTDNQYSNNDSTYCPSNRTFFFYLEPKEGFTSFPDKITNLRSNQDISIMHSTFKASIPKSKMNTDQNFPYNFFSGLCAFFMLIICIVIPVQFYLVIGSITDEVIFEKTIIKRIRTIGISLIFFYFLYSLYNYLNYKKNSQLFEFSDYTLKMDSSDAIWLLMGFVALLIAEIISRGLKLKEEQELTI
jgi:hypothetical protein